MMVLVKSVPTTSSRRFFVNNRIKYTKDAGESRLISGKRRSYGRNCHGHITVRHRGGGHKRLYRQVDFKRNKFDIPATVAAFEYDPNRSAYLALLNYADGEKRYILAPEGIQIGDSVINLNKTVSNYKVGMSFPLSCIPTAVKIHAVELIPGNGAVLARTAGSSLEIVGFDKGYAQVKMSSGEVRLLDERCRATIGAVGNADHQNVTLGKAGRARWLGIRPRVRGCAMNPVDHPMGGGETGGGNHPVSPWGQLAKGSITRRRKNISNRFILVRRNGKKVKKI